MRTTTSAFPRSQLRASLKWQVAALPSRFSGPRHHFLPACLQRPLALSSSQSVLHSGQSCLHMQRSRVFCGWNSPKGSTPICFPPPPATALSSGAASLLSPNTKLVPAFTCVTAVPTAGRCCPDSGHFLVRSAQTPS